MAAKKGGSGRKSVVMTPAGPRPRAKVRAVPRNAGIRIDKSGRAVVEPVARTPRAATALPRNIVVTPGGYRSSSLVHLVKPGHVLRVTDGRHRMHTLAGKMMADFGRIPLRPGREPLMPGGVSLGAAKARAAQVPALGTGWITYASWNNNTGNPITLFVTSWAVPPAPRTNNDQLIYLFNGIQNATMIYQPVLQWGNNGAFGGSYWVVASWYADGQGGQAFHTQPVRVNPGDTLFGLITLVDQAGTVFSYNCEFIGLPGTSLPIQNVQELTWCCQTLEAYRPQQCSDYPNADFTAFRSIAILTGNSVPAVNWRATDSVTDCGQHTTVVSNANPGGEVDIFYTRYPTNLFVPVYAQGDPGNGIGGYDLKSKADRVFAFDYDHSGKMDHLALYRPATGTIWILKHTGGAFSPVYAQGDPGSGIGGYDLKSKADLAFAFDYDHSGKMDHLALYRPGTGTIWILKHSGGTFSPVYAQGDPGSGIGGYDLKSKADRVFAFDYDHSGKMDHLALYRPATGTFWILKRSGGTFTPVYAQGDPGNGIGGYDLKSPADQAFAFDYDHSGKMDHLALYRPATGTMWILKNTGGTFSAVYAQGDPGSGIGEYDLKSSADRAFAFDFDHSGKMDHLALYRPGTGTIWVLKNTGGTFTPVYAQGDPGRGIGGYDLMSSADQASCFDYDHSGKMDHLILYRPGTGTIWILRRR